MTEKKMLPKRDWIGGTIRVPPLKGQIQQQGQVVFGQDGFPPFPPAGGWGTLAIGLPFAGDFQGNGG